MSIRKKILIVFVQQLFLNVLEPTMKRALFNYFVHAHIFVYIFSP